MASRVDWETPSVTADEARIGQMIVRAAIEHHAVFSEAEAANLRVAAGVTEALGRVAKLSASLTKLTSQTQHLGCVGQVWRRDKQMASNAVTQYQKLTAFLEAPATLEDCIRSDMYHEVLLIMDHIAASCHQMGDVGLLKQLLAGLYASLERAIADVVLPRLASPLAVASAVKITTFLRRLGVDDLTLRHIFLQKRGEYIDALVREAEQSAAPYSFVFKFTTIYKVHVSEVIVRYHACFPTEEQAGGGSVAGAVAGAPSISDPLAGWCHEQSRRFVQAFQATLQRISSGAELASVAEQCTHCSSATSKVFLDVLPLLSKAVVRRVTQLFESQIVAAKASYTASMASFAWKLPHNYTPATTQRPRDSAAIAAPPVSLVQWLPLAYALNGVISACNDIRKCVVPGVELPCTGMVASLVKLMAGDLCNVQHVLSAMEHRERHVFDLYVDAFVNDFVPHVQQCIARLFARAPLAEITLRDETHGMMEALRRSAVPPPAPRGAPPSAGAASDAGTALDRSSTRLASPPHEPLSFAPADPEAAAPVPTAPSPPPVAEVRGTPESASTVHAASAAAAPAAYPSPQQTGEASPDAPDPSSQSWPSVQAPAGFEGVSPVDVTSLATMAAASLVPPTTLATHSPHANFTRPEPSVKTAAINPWADGSSTLDPFQFEPPSAGGQGGPVSWTASAPHGASTWPSEKEA